MTKSLLLKGLAGAATVAGAVGGGSLFWFKDDIFGDNKAAQIKTGENEFTQRELIDNAGLSCGLSDEEKEITGDTTKECSIKENGTISIKVGDQTEEGVTFNSTSGSAKLKVGRSREGVGKEGETAEVYNGKLKFVVDSGDITLTKKEGNTTPTTITKLEQFETYEIEKDGDKFYLKRKTKADVGIKNALGLGELTLPDAGGSDTGNSYNDEKKKKQIRFEGHGEGISVTGEIGLKVSMSGDTTTFPYGYRFNFTFPADVTINGKQLKGKIPYEFKIKKHENSNNLTLEQAWTDNNVFTKKAGLDCTNSGTNGCTVPAGSQKLNVKVGNQKKTDISSVTTGKIKMETDQQGYNQGLKFTIAEGDVTISDGTGDGITKLEELETYEITEDGGKYYLTKKTSPDELIKKTLVLPDGCKLPGETSVVCTLNQENFKKINFDGKGGDVASAGDVTLTISKGNSTDFPFGYRFTFSAAKEATVTSSNKIKANIPTDFKIKKGSGSGTSVSLTLEKAWSDFSLAEKAGLKCTGSTGSECCTMDSAGGSPSVKLNVKKGNDKKEDITGIGTTPGKIKVEKDKEGYNQGLKFTISEGDVSLTGGATKSGADFTTLEELETYEITEEGGKYYLTRKDEAIKTIESQLGLKEAGCSLSGTSSTCSNLTSDKLKKINFSDKESEKPTISSGTATLTITKTDNKTDFPLGYKFTLKSTTGDITIKATDNIVKQNISTDFKIKKATGGASLTLEKAWTSSTLGAKVGLKCCDDTSGECTIDGTEGKKLRVKQLSENDGEIKQTALTKKTSNAGSGKIKVTKDQAGYNQGFKFEISDGFIELDGSTGTDENDKITRLGEYETYEIKEIGSDGWFLSIKNKADDFVLKELGLENIDGCSSLKLPRSTTGDTCDIKKLEVLKKIKFGNTNSSSWPSSVDAQLQISQESSLPLGFKFTFTNNGDETLCLPDGNGGKVGVSNTGSSSVDYKIKKSGSGTSATLCLEKKNGSSSSSGCSK